MLKLKTIARIIGYIYITSRIQMQITILSKPPLLHYRISSVVILQLSYMIQYLTNWFSLSKYNFMKQFNNNTSYNTLNNRNPLYNAIEASINVITINNDSIINALSTL